jgi:hypothetical protein
MTSGYASDDDDRDLTGVCLRGDVLSHQLATDIRKPQIEDDEIGRVEIDKTERIEPVSGFLHVEAGERERNPKHSAQIGVVFNN